MPSSITRSFTLGTGKAGVGLDEIFILGSLEGTPATLGSITSVTTDGTTGQITAIAGTGTFRSLKVERGTGQVTQTSTNSTGGRNVAAAATMVLPGISQDQKMFINELEGQQIDFVSVQKGTVGGFLYRDMTVTGVVLDGGVSGGDATSVAATITVSGDFFNYADELSAALTTVAMAPITVQ